MKFQIIGEDRDTGGRRTFEVEAESKAAAERKARDRKVDVRSVRDVSEGGDTTPINYGRPRRSRGRRRLLAVILVLVLLALAWYAWRSDWLPIS